MGQIIVDRRAWYQKKTTAVDLGCSALQNWRPGRRESLGRHTRELTSLGANGRRSGVLKGWDGRTTTQPDQSGKATHLQQQHCAVEGPSQHCKMGGRGLDGLESSVKLRHGQCVSKPP